MSAHRETVLIWLFLIGLALINFINWIGGDARRGVREGDRCGPAHHWIYVTADISGSELSCESD